MVSEVEPKMQIDMVSEIAGIYFATGCQKWEHCFNTMSEVRLFAASWCQEWNYEAKLPVVFVWKRAM